MDAPSGKRSKLLPANAYSKLAPGEAYKPIVPADDRRHEVTLWSVMLGVIMVAVWAAACVFVALRAGTGVEAAIPIAVLAIFFGKLRAVRSTILENVMVQSIGQASGVVAAGAAFVVPALYINELQPTWWHVALATFIGGALGVALIIPLRKYFVKDQHGELPFPEATAINEILVSGESTGKGAGKILLMAVALGAGFDFLTGAVSLWNKDLVTTTLLGGWGEQLGAARIGFSIDATAMLFGLGFIIGLRYAAIIASGSVLAYVVMVPLVYLIGSSVQTPGAPGGAPLELAYAGKTYVISQMSADAIWASFVRPIGIGAIAISGLIGLIRMGKIVVASVSLGFKGLSKATGEENAERTQRDMKARNVLGIQLATTVGMGALFFIVASTRGTYSMGQAWMFAGVGMLVAFALSFLFTPVAAQAIAIVGTNPVSGMTLITIVISAAVMAGMGLAGKAGMFIALVIGTAVCTALSTSGALVTDFKIGYWIGSTPRNQQIWKFVGLAVAALTVAFIIPLMDSAYHFLVRDPATGQMVSNTGVLQAPQANMLAVVTKGLMERAQQPVLLYSVGGLIAVLLYMAGVPMLAFALGMYLPIGLNMGVLAGGFAAWLVGKTGETPEIREARKGQGTLIASGLMAGAALVGIVTAVMRVVEVGAPIQYISVGKKMWVEPDKLSGASVLQEHAHKWFEGRDGQLIGLVAFLGLGVLCYLFARLGARWELAEAKSAEAGEKKK